MGHSLRQQHSLSEQFQQQHPQSSNDNGRAIETKPFSIRLSDNEREYLESQAGNKPLGSYIRQRLLGDMAHKRRTQRKPSLGDEQYASLRIGLVFSMAWGLSGV